MIARNAASLERWIRRGLYLVLAVPLLPTLPVLFPTTFGRALDFMLLVAAASVAAILEKSKRPESVPTPPSLVGKLFFVYLAVAAAATAVSTVPALSFWGDQGRADGLLVWLFAGAFFLLIRSFLPGERERVRALAVTVSAALIVAALAILQFFVPVFRTIMGAPGERVSGTLGNPIFLAGYLLPNLFFGLFFALRARSAVVRGAWVLATILIAVGLILTQSKGGTLGLVVGILALLVLAGVSARTRQQKLLAAGAIIILLYGVVGVAFKFPGSQLLPPSVRALNIDGANTLETRLINWQIAFEGFKDRPFLGNGPETYREVFVRHYRPALAQYSFAETVSDKPHNLFMEVLVETGFLGILAFLAVLGAAAVFLLQELRRRPLYAGFLFAALVAYAVNEFFSFDSSASRIVFVLLLALATPERTALPNPNAVTRFPTIAASLGALALIAPLLMVLRSVPASAYTRDAVDAATSRAPTLWLTTLKLAVARPTVFSWENIHHLARWHVLGTNNGSFPEAVSRESANIILPRLEKATARADRNFVLHYLKGQMYELRGEAGRDAEDFRRAEASFRVAAALSPDHQMLAVAIGRLRLAEGNPKGAIEIFQKSVAIDPEAAEPHWYLGLALAADRQFEGAVREMTIAVDHDRGFKSVSERVYYVNLLGELKRYDEIVKQYQALIREQPDEPAWHTQLAATYLHLNRPELAILEAQRAVEIDPRVRDSARAFLKSFGLDLP